jgi:alpha/beta superfamily hydrolase
MLYQQMVHVSHSFYLNFFLNRGINVIAWNYRGYGRSSGTSTPNSLKQDVDTVCDYVVKRLGFVGKLGVYGRSLGGIPSSHLANKVQMAIIDRSFGNFKDMAKHKYFGIAAWWIFKVGSCGWQIENDFEFS